jgi:hypothetical protein
MPCHLARLSQDILGKRMDQPGLLGEGNESLDGDDAPIRIDPARGHLEADKFLDGKPHSRLEDRSIMFASIATRNARSRAARS